MNLDITTSLIIAIGYVMMPKWILQLKSLVITLSLNKTLDFMLTKHYHTYKILLYFCNNLTFMHTIMEKL